MFREFNVKFEDVEMLGGADSLLEGTEITKVIVRGDNNKMSSLDSMLKNCNELDTIDGELDLNGVGDIDNLLEGTELVKSINLKNINNENITANNSFPHIEEINIGGELYNKKAMQNVIASKDWTFDNINYQGTVGDNIVTKEVNIVDDNEVTIQDTLEQKARGFEIIGQTYENLVVGSGEATLLDELTLESVDGNSKEFNPHLEQPVCVEAIEGETYQNLIEGKGEYKLTDTYSHTWTEENNTLENMPNAIEIPEIWGNTVQGYARAVSNKDLVNHMNNLGYSNVKFELIDDDTMIETNWGYWHPENYRDTIASDNSKALQLKPNTSYSFRTSIPFFDRSAIVSTTNILLSLKDTLSGTFTTDDTGLVAIVLMTNPHNTPFNFILVEGDVVPNIPFDLNYIQSVGDLYVDESGEPILDEEGNEQYKLDIISHNKNLLPLDFKVFNAGATGDWSNGSIKEELLEKDDEGYYTGIQTGWTHVFWTDKIKINPSKSYSFFAISKQGNRCYNRGMFFYDKYNNFIERWWESTSFNKKEIIPPKNASFMRILIACQNDKSNNHSAKFYMFEGAMPNNYTFDLVEDKQKWLLDNGYCVEREEDKTTILMPQQLKGLDNVKDKLFYDYKKSMYIIENKIGDFNNINDLSEAVLSMPKTVETKILDKISLETYSPKTYISTNAEIQPSKMTVTNKKVDFIPLGLQANKDYTLQLDSTGKNDKPITVNLGGTETTVQPINDTSKHHKVVVRTPSTVTTDKLDLSGEGVIVNDVMLFEGGSNEIKQEVEYVEGIQNIGELQEDGTYKIEILTESPILKGLTKTSKQNSATIITPKRFMIESKNGSWSNAGISASSTYKKLNTPYTACVKVISKNLLDNNYEFAGSWSATSNAFLGYKPDLEVGVVYKKSITPQSNVKEGDTICIFQFNNKAVDGQYIELEIWLEEDIVKSEVQMLLPQPLNKIGEIKDKFYWDDNKGHYCIEENAPKIDLHTMDWTYTHNNNLPEDEISFIVSNYCQNNNISVPSYNANLMRLTIKHNIPILDTSINAVGEGDAFAYHGSGSVYFKTKKTNIVNDSPIPYLKEKDYFIIVTRPTPNIIDLPHLNKKYSLDTYMPTTYLECTNSPMQPSRILLESDTVRYKPSALETDTDYTIQFECKEKSDKKVKLNLGGTEKEVDAEVGLNHVSITTPSEIDTSLYKDRLFLSGAGNKVADVIVNKGEMNQYPKYFNGVQNTGELQDDGTYRIGLETNCGEGLDFSNTKPTMIINQNGNMANDSYVTSEGYLCILRNDGGYGYNQLYGFFDTDSIGIPRGVDCYVSYRTLYMIVKDIGRVNLTNQPNRYGVVVDSSSSYVTGSNSGITTGVINIPNDGARYYLRTQVSYDGYALQNNTCQEFCLIYNCMPTNLPVTLENFKPIKKHKTSIALNSPLAKGDKLYWNKSNKRYEIDRSGSIEVPTVEGDIIDLPRLYQGEDTHLTVESGNIKPSKIKIDYNDLD